jgi:hypothetical protein
MRDLIVAYITANPVEGFALTDELPWTKGGVPLYQKNMKKIYVDRTQTVQEPLFDTLDGMSAVIETQTVSVYVATDAKTLPSNYETLVTTLRAAKNDSSFVIGNTERQVNVSTEYDVDALVTRFDFTFNLVL